MAQQAAVTTAETAALHRAAALAALGAPTCSPNPAVGCVVLDAGGTHRGRGLPRPRRRSARRGGGARARPGAAARGGTAVVTLEPCRHTGRTGPCTEALLDAGVARVVVGVADPTAQAGGGAAVLRAAGVDVVVLDGPAADLPGSLAEAVAAAEAVTQRWLTAVRLGRPHTTWKFAATPRRSDRRGRRHVALDHLAAGPRRRPPPAGHLRRGRGRASAPCSPTTRTSPSAAPTAPSRGRSRCGWSSTPHGRTPATARVRDDAAPTWVATAAEVGRGRDGPLDLAALGAALFARGVRTVLLEGGATLAGAYVAAGLVDRVVAYLAPALLGAGPAALGPAGIADDRRRAAPGDRPTSPGSAPTSGSPATPTRAERR